MFHLCRNQVVTLPQVFFKHFARKNQLLGLFVNGTLVKNKLMFYLVFVKEKTDLKTTSKSFLTNIQSFICNFVFEMTTTYF